jgi:hypothetical protein
MRCSAPAPSAHWTIETGPRSILNHGRADANESRDHRFGRIGSDYVADRDRPVTPDSSGTGTLPHGGLKSALPGCRQKSAQPGLRPESRVRLGNPRSLDEALPLVHA